MIDHHQIKVERFDYERRRKLFGDPKSRADAMPEAILHQATLHLEGDYWVDGSIQRYHREGFEDACRIADASAKHAIMMQLYEEAYQDVLRLEGEMLKVMRNSPLFTATATEVIELHKRIHQILRKLDPPT